MVDTPRRIVFVRRVAYDRSILEDKFSVTTPGKQAKEAHR